MEICLHTDKVQSGRIWKQLGCYASSVYKKVCAWEDSAQRECANATASRLLDEYGNCILRLAYAYLHNMSDAEEILQDTIIKYLSAKPDIVRKEHEKNWLYRTASNLSKNRIEYNQLRYADELEENLAAEEREDLGFVWEAVKALPVNIREAVHLFYHEGCSTAQIAQILGRKETTVRSDLLRGRKKLKEILKEEYDFE